MYALKMTAPDDHALLVCAQGGDREALQAFARRRFTWMRRIALLQTGDPSLADDAVQDAMVALIRNLDHWDPSRAVEPWLGTLVRNAARRVHRKRGPLREVTEESASPGRIDREVDLRRGAQQAIEAFEDLSEGQRTALYLCDVQGMTGVEASTLMDVSPATVRVHLHRARTAIRERLGALHELLKGDA